MKIVAIVQARMGSSRLPGKVMKEVCGKSILSHVISRISQCSLVDQVVVATTTNDEDDILIREADNLGVSSFRGSEDNVLSRYYHAASAYRADVVIRVTSDCPLFDPTILTEIVAVFLKKNSQARCVDYLSNTLDRTYPRGLDAEVLYFDVLKTAYQEADKNYEKEHVTPYVYQHADKFIVEQYRDADHDYSEYRWTLDTVEDFKFIETVYHALWERTRLFQTADIYRLLERNPFILDINSHIEQKKLGE